MIDSITDQDRYPTLSEHGRKLLEFMREHPCAPIFRYESGNRLLLEEVESQRAFAQEVLAARIGWQPGHFPSWLESFIGHCLSTVPFYRKYGRRPASLLDLPAISRADLSRDVAQFVPDTVPIDRLINFRTSGTTGHPLLLASHPVVAARYLAFHQRALRRFGIELKARRGEVGVVLAGYQRRCFTYVSVTPTMDEAGLAKINLHPNDWRDPQHRAPYLDAMNPEVYSGDPISFAELAELPLKTRPRALLSTSMALLPGLRKKLEDRFGCPVLDLYSMNEAGPVAVADPRAGGHVLLQHQLYVEILDPQGHPVPTGHRGEVTLTGGFNFCLPLLRYRTGDFASLRLDGDEPVLVDLAGRPPVTFRTPSGEQLNNIEITHALQSFAIPQYTLHQFTDGKLRLRLIKQSASPCQLLETFERVFGSEVSLEIEEVDTFEGKVIQYTSDFVPSAQ